MTPMKIRDNRKAGWFWIDNGILDEHGAVIGPYGIAIYAALARFANSNGEAFPSTSRLADLTGCNRDTVSHILTMLQERGLIAIVRKPGSVNVYHLLSFPQPVGHTDRYLSATPTAPVGHTDRYLSATPTAPVGHTDRNKTQLTRPTEQDLTKDDEQDDIAQPVEKSSSSNPQFSSWEDLETEYGTNEVKRAIAAAPEAKRASLRYVGGILRNWRKEKTGKRVRSRQDPFDY